jgi:uncharacterized DUF497 family protein
VRSRRADDLIQSCTGFDWDEWNTSKNWEKHRVSPEEAEAIFFCEPLLLRSDAGHSKSELRFAALGKTPEGRGLLVICTVRRQLIRVISARDMNRRESEAYARYEKENS